MKLTNKKILNDIHMLNNLSNLELPVKVSYKIAKNIMNIEKELKVYNTQIQKLIDKYCLKDENNQNVIDENNNFTIDDKYLDKWNKKINELLDIEVDIEILTFKIDELMYDNYKMTPSQLMLIDYMIED